MKPTLSPHQAAIAFQQGDEAGFNFFFNELYNALVYYSNRFMKDRLLAEGIASTAFIKAWKVREIFIHEKQLKSWLYTTVRNESLNNLVAINRRLVREGRAAIPLSKDFERSHDEAMIEAEVISEVSKYLHPLPTACKKIFMLYYYHGMVDREIADYLHIAETTVRNQIQRGLKIIRGVHGVSGLNTSVSGVLYRPKEKKKALRNEIIQLLNQGVKMAAIATNLHISYSTVAAVTKHLRNDVEKRKHTVIRAYLSEGRKCIPVISEELGITIGTCKTYIAEYRKAHRESFS